MRRRIAVFTSSRADLGPLGPVVEALDAEPRIELSVIASGTHVVEAFGGRLGDIRLSHGNTLEVLDAGLEGTEPAELGETFGRIASGTSGILSGRPIDVLVLLGDRWELLAVAGVAVLHGVAIAHLHGGETTEGAIDERIRHGVTKLSDLHLCATEDSARRIRNLGEEPWRIEVTGAPGLDRLATVEAMPEGRLAKLLGGRVRRPFGVVVYHPPTVDRTRVAARARAVFEAAAASLGSALCLYPGADPGAEAVIRELEAALDRHPHLAAARNLGPDYLPTLKAADILLGNSSSGIIEAASMELPVVDVGDRQGGRLRPRNVIHVDEDEARVHEAVRRVLEPAFRESLRGLANPYGDGRASRRIVEALLAAPLERLTRKPLLQPPSGRVHLDRLTIAPGFDFRQAMVALQESRAQIVFVADDANRLLGSLSDGDVRRALLAGASLEDPVDGAVNRVPVVASPDDGPQAVVGLMQRNGISQIPVVDDQGILIGVHLLHAIVGKALDEGIPGSGPPTGAYGGEGT